MDINQIIHFFQNLPIQDYIIFWVSLWFFILFVFAWVEKIYKAYLGIILGLFIFSIVNLTLNSLNQNDIGLNSMRDFFLNNKESIWFYSVLLIPILSILLPLNKNIWFRVSKNKPLNYLVLFVFWICFFIFFFSVFLSIVNNKFLFTMDNSIITQVRESYIVNLIYEYFSPSYIFNFLIQYDYIINLVIILFIFYKMTIGGMIDFLLAKIFKMLGKMFEKKANDEPKSQEAHH